MSQKIQQFPPGRCAMKHFSIVKYDISERVQDSMGSVAAKPGSVSFCVFFFLFLMYYIGPSPWPHSFYVYVRLLSRSRI